MVAIIENKKAIWLLEQLKIIQCYSIEIYIKT